LRVIAGRAVAAAAKLFPDTYLATLATLFDYYKSHLPTPEQVKYESELVSSWVHCRSGVAAAIKEFSIISHTPDQLKVIFEFLLGLPFNEKDRGMYRKFDEAGAAIISAESDANLNEFVIPYFLDIVSTPPNQKGEKNWNIYESCLGFLLLAFRVIPRGSPEISRLVKALIDCSFFITSQDCRLVIAQALIKLVSLNKDEGKKHLPRCFELATTAKDQNDRRGAAFCFGGLAKGVGISTVLITMGYLQEITKNLKSTDLAALQGSIFLVEALSITAQRLWEPYIIHVLAPLMNCFGHKDKKIQEATKRAGKVIMQNVSGGGLKIVLPGILASLTERSVWQAKIGSIEMLSILAHSQPKQLPTSLPIIIPALAGVLADTHTKVQDTAKKALQDIGKVIKNPEIQDHVPLLLDAIDDPAVHSAKALEALLNTHFVHHIDSASLSFIMPVIKRALADRNTSNKTKATKILGNMCQLTSHSDLKPYLEGLMNEIRSVLLDPIPSTRATAAKAVGTLVRGMGEEEFSGLVSWLLDTIQNSPGFIERSGAAQGLSEVIAALPEHRFKLDLFPYVVQQTESERPSTREGFVSVFQFLPDAWGLSFAPYLDKALPIITRGLADEVDGVREASLKAGQAVVAAYALHATDLLVPSLKKGIFDDNWRIRQSSVQLLGEFLGKALGRPVNTGAGGANDEDSVAQEDLDIGGVIGADSANEILSVLYIVRNDPNQAVQQRASTTWKSVVSNTPKMLKSILPGLMKIVVAALEQRVGDKRQVACDTLADIVIKLGHRVLPEILPHLDEALASSSPALREGACLGLCDVMGASGKSFLLDFLDKIIPAVRIGLSDEVGMVQEAAAKAFDVLYENVGSVAINEIIPQLLHNLEDEDERVSHMALNGLKQMLAVRSTVVLPFVVPSLLTTPMTVFNAKALASLAEVSGVGLFPHLKSILLALLPAVYQDMDTPNDEILKATTRVIRAIQEESGVDMLLSQLLDLAKNIKPLWRLASVSLLGKFVVDPLVDFSGHITQIVSTCLDLLADPFEKIQEEAVKAMNASLKAITSDTLEYIVGINGALDVLQVWPPFPFLFPSLLPLTLFLFLFPPSSLVNPSPRESNTTPSSRAPPGPRTTPCPDFAGRTVWTASCRCTWRPSGFPAELKHVSLFWRGCGISSLCPPGLLSRQRYFFFPFFSSLCLSFVVLSSPLLLLSFLFLSLFLPFPSSFSNPFLLLIPLFQNKHIKIVGPLIRIYGPKLETPVKIQIINTIKSLLVVRKKKKEKRIPGF
jgi:HEAT repeat protein